MRKLFAAFTSCRSDRARRRFDLSRMGADEHILRKQSYLLGNGRMDIRDSDCFDVDDRYGAIFHCLDYSSPKP